MGLGEKPFVGGEALANGWVRKHELRSRYRAVFPDVYIATNIDLTLLQRARAAWLWSHRHGVISGLTASALHGSKWIDAGEPVELIWANARPARGLRTHDMRLLRGEYRQLHGLPVTTVQRTAFDIGRSGRLGQVVARLDALGNATRFAARDVMRIATNHPGVRGLRVLRTALDLFDPGAQSPRETWLRLLLIREGFPPPQTQIRVLSPDGLRRYFLDMGWEDIKLAVEYDGDQHRVDPVRFAYDVMRLEDLHELGWTNIRVTRRHRAADVVQRVRRAWDAHTR